MQWAETEVPAMKSLYFGPGESMRIKVKDLGGGCYLLLAQRDSAAFLKRKKKHPAEGKWLTMSNIEIKRIKSYASSNYGSAYHKMVHGKKAMKKHAMALAGTVRLLGGNSSV